MNREKVEIRVSIGYARQGAIKVGKWQERFKHGLLVVVMSETVTQHKVGLGFGRTGRGACLVFEMVDEAIVCSGEGEKLKRDTNGTGGKLPAPAS